MGGFFAPDPPSPPPPAPVPSVPAAPDPEIAAAQARQDTIDRNRRGLLGTIATSENGVLLPQPTGGAKTLLGE